MLSFIGRFDIEQSAGCSEDFVEVGHHYIMHSILKEHICTLSCYTYASLCGEVIIMCDIAF
jgi:hypothetical protein